MIVKAEKFRPTRASGSCLSLKDREVGEFVV